MELASVFRLLWARRILAGLGIVVALAAGVLAGHKAQARSAAAGGTVSTLALMLDTSDSQLIAAAPAGAWTLPHRASLLADAVASDAAVRATARRAGVPAKDLAVLGPAARRLPAVDSPLVSQVYRLASTWAAPYTVNVFADNVTPIIKVQAQAPTPARAARLARAAGDTLRSTLVLDDGRDKGGFVLDTVAPLRTKHLPVKSSHASLMMVAGALATFVFWCAGIVLAVSLGRRVLALRRPRPA